jgi:hypothetical protein
MILLAVRGASQPDGSVLGRLSQCADVHLPGSGSGVLGSGFKVWGSGFRICGLGIGFEVQSLGSGLKVEVPDFEFRVPGSGFRVLGLRFRISAFGVRAWRSWGTRFRSTSVSTSLCRGSHECYVTDFHHETNFQHKLKKTNPTPVPRCCG